jgi:putative FmdB family regulatory protein
MPIYEYRCRVCGFQFEVMQKMDTDPPRCPRCNCFPGARLVSEFSAHYKGSGFYTTDYPQKNQ